MPNLNAPPRSGKFNEEIERKRLRDQFAGRAMEGLMREDTAVQGIAQANGKSFGDMVGIIAYEVADGMMKAREGK